jgi:hypothetical protein
LLLLLLLLLRRRRRVRLRLLCICGLLRLRCVGRRLGRGRCVSGLLLWRLRLRLRLLLLQKRGERLLRLLRVEARARLSLRL